MSERLTTAAMMDAALALCRREEPFKALDESAQIHEKIKVFEAVVWFPRLQAQVNGTDSRGMSGTCRDIKVMTWCCAGRCLIQLERDGHRLTLITADDEAPWRREMAHVAPPMGPMGLQGIDADFIEAIKILYEATRHGALIRLAPDDGVTIG